jgi:cation diffusion facilitator family transporter
MIDLLCKPFIKDYQNIQDATVRGRYGTFSSVVGVAVNFLLALAKIITGIISGSVAITADGINNLSDAGSSGISFISFRIASKPADRDHPFGHARIEYVASLIVSFLIAYVGLDMLLTSGKTVLGLSEAAAVKIELLSFIVLAASIVTKLLLGLFNLGIAKRIDSSVIKAAAMDSFSDCISTSAVLVSTIIIHFTNWVIVDAIVGLGVSILILIAGIKIMLETNNSILGEAPVAETVASIENIVAEYPEVLGIHDMMVHDYGPGRSIASFHAEVSGEENIYELHDVIDNVERRINTELGILCTIHLDPIAINDTEVSRLRAIAEECSKKIDEKITIHDFRTVIGTTHTNLIFDVVLPFESKLTPEAVTSLIEKEVKLVDESYFCVITVDRG